MARIMFVWECGAGLSHMSQYVKLIDRLIKDKHEILFVVQNVASAERLFKDKSVQIAQTPLLNENLEGGVVVPKSYVHVLRNQGFASHYGLLGRLKAWLFMYRSWKPDLIISDHGPTAVLASHCLNNTGLILGGNGFSLPPQDYPMAPFQLPEQLSKAQLLEEEHELLNEFINPCMESLGGPIFKKLCEIFRSDARWLYSFREMDHYPNRENDEYLGVETEVDGVQPVWPEHNGPKIYAYLKPYKMVDTLLSALKQLAYPSLIYGDQFPDSYEKRYAGSTIKFSPKLLNLSMVAEQSQLAITNANTSSTSQFLLKGVPVLMIPLHIEQYLSAVTIQNMGCGCHVQESRNHQDQLTKLIEQLVQRNSSYSRKAIEFSKRYQSHQPGDISKSMYTKVQSLIGA